MVYNPTSLSAYFCQSPDTSPDYSLHGSNLATTLVCEHLLVKLSFSGQGEGTARACHMLPFSCDSFDWLC